MVVTVAKVFLCVGVLSGWNIVLLLRTDSIFSISAFIAYLGLTNRKWCPLATHQLYYGYIYKCQEWRVLQYLWWPSSSIFFLSENHRNILFIEFVFIKFNMGIFLAEGWTLLGKFVFRLSSYCKTCCWCWRVKIFPNSILNLELIISIKTSYFRFICSSLCHKGPLRLLMTYRSELLKLLSHLFD